MLRSTLAADHRAAAKASPSLEPKVACPQCGRATAWSACAPVKVLDGVALASHLTVPADGWFVDVRACSGCGRALARKARRT